MYFHNRNIGSVQLRNFAYAVALPKEIKVKDLLICQTE